MKLPEATLDFLKDEKNRIEEAILTATDDAEYVEFEDCVIKKRRLLVLYSDCVKILKGEELSDLRVPVELVFTSERWIKAVRAVRTATQNT